MTLNESFNCPEFLCNDIRSNNVCQMIVLMIKRHNGYKASFKTTMVIANTKYFFCASLNVVPLLIQSFPKSREAIPLILLFHG